MNAPPKGISGRWFTIGFGILLAAGVVIGFSVVIRFQKVMTALDDVRQLWPDAAIVIEDRYQTIDHLISKIEAGKSEVSDARLDAWNQAWTKFQSSTQYDRQAPIMERLESLADDLVPEHDRHSGTPNIPPSLEKFLQADRALRSLQADGLGWLCKQIFRMNIPDQVYSLLE